MEPVTISILASAAVKILAPFFKQALTKGTSDLADRAGEAAGKGAFEAGSRIGALIRRKFKGNESAEAAVAKLESNPDDAHAAAELQGHLEQAALSDPTFAQELSAQVAMAANTTAETAFVNQVGGDVAKIAQIGTVNGDVTF
jgi:hypothetical protein